MPGDSWVLAWSTAEAILPPGALGTLGLDPGKLRVLDTGVVGGPYNVSTVKAALPLGAGPYGDVPRHFQAVVMGEWEARLTNVTALSLRALLESPMPPSWAEQAFGRTAPYAPTAFAQWLRPMASSPEPWRGNGKGNALRPPVVERGR